MWSTNLTSSDLELYRWEDVEGMGNSVDLDQKFDTRSLLFKKK